MITKLKNRLKLSFETEEIDNFQIG